ncbi:hypothetical protein [Prevotella pallens]
MNRPLRLTECSPRVSWADVALLTIRSQHYWQPVSSRRGRFIVPAYTYTPTK